MTNNKGFIKLSRSFFSHKMWKAARTFSDCEAWLDLIQSARFDAKPHTESIGGREITYGRGQYPASIRYLSERWSWGEKKVRLYLLKLAKHQMITTDNSQGMTVITLCKYPQYNDPDTPRTQTTTQQGQAEGTNYKKEEERKERKEREESNIPSSSPKGYEEYDFYFVNPDFFTIFCDWIEYKRSRKQKYKSQKSLEQCYKNLINHSEGSPATAQAIINNAIGCNYAGFFPLKKATGNHYQHPSTERLNEKKYELF